MNDKPKISAAEVAEIKAIKEGQIKTNSIIRK